MKPDVDLGGGALQITLAKVGRVSNGLNDELEELLSQQPKMHQNEQ